MSYYKNFSNDYQEPPERSDYPEEQEEYESMYDAADRVKNAWLDERASKAYDGCLMTDCAAVEELRCKPHPSWIMTRKEMLEYELSLHVADAVARSEK